MANLLARIAAVDPDVILIDLENPSRDTLEQMFQVSRLARRPIAMFVDKSDSATVQAAIDAGVSAYVVDGLRKERVRSILDVTISRFHAFDRLQSELHAGEVRARGPQDHRAGEGDPHAATRLLRGRRVRAAAAHGDESEPQDRGARALARGCRRVATHGRASMTERIVAAFVPLVDCAVLVAAREQGFAAEEGLDLVLVKEPSWASLRDHLCLGHVDCAHALAPLPVALTLGVGHVQVDCIAPFVLGRGGNAVTVSNALFARDAEAAGTSASRIRREAGRALRGRRAASARRR